MGLKHPPPQNTTRDLFSEEFLLGNTQLTSNTFQYSSVCLGNSWYSVLYQEVELASILAI